MAATPTGSVSIFDASNNLFAQAVLNGSGVGAALLNPPQTPGTYTGWTATYSGDGNYNNAISAPFSYVVNPDSAKGNVNVTVVVSPNPALPENAITFTVTVTPV